MAICRRWRVRRVLVPEIEAERSFAACHRRSSSAVKPDGLAAASWAPQLHTRVVLAAEFAFRAGPAWHTLGGGSGHAEVGQPFGSPVDALTRSQMLRAACSRSRHVRSCLRWPAAHRLLVQAAAPAQPQSAAAPRGKLLVLGGTGFVGQRVCRLALDDGWAVVSLSRRGRPAAGDGVDSRVVDNVDWRTADATQPDAARSILAEGGYHGVFHCVGMLFASDLNRLVSGSGSVPSQGATYDAVTRQTALAAAAAAAELCARGPGGEAPPFGFVSAAEAGWTFDAPVEWLQLYLIAKRAVERELLEGYAPAGLLRPFVLRPSLIFDASARPFAMPAVAAFWAANAIGLPFVDRPVTVGTLSTAAVAGLRDPSVSGILDWRRMEAIATGGQQ